MRPKVDPCGIPKVYLKNHLILSLPDFLFSVIVTDTNKGQWFFIETESI